MTSSFARLVRRMTRSELLIAQHVRYAELAIHMRAGGDIPGARIAAGHARDFLAQYDDTDNASTTRQRYREIVERGQLEDRMDYTIEDLEIVELLSRADATSLYNMIQRGG